MLKMNECKNEFNIRNSKIYTCIIAKVFLLRNYRFISENYNPKEYKSDGKIVCSYCNFRNLMEKNDEEKDLRDNF